VTERGKLLAGAALTIGLSLLAALVVGGYFAHEHFVRDTPHGKDFAIWDDPTRTISLPNDTGAPRVLLRCQRADECQTPVTGELVQPRESFDFKLYLDEDRTYMVADAQGRTLGCVTVPIADGTPYPGSLSDLMACPRGTPRTS
jgi:hypothetical protein